MKKIFKSILSLILVMSMLVCATVPAFAVDGEEYISELRIIYADDYEEAKEILEDSEFSDYKLLKENLNEDTGEIGVWIAYKTTTDIEEAITDLAVMQMNGGYTEGNYQEMIKQSYDEYVAMGETYVKAIEYFMYAYDEGHYLSEVAYRQLNFYNVESEGIPEDEIPYFEGELLGDIFYNGVDEYDLATMFLQGNSYVLRNVRSLISMGVSYNEDGKTYLDKVGEEAEKMNADSGVYDDEDYDDIAAIIDITIKVFRDMFEELATVEDELNYDDEEFTDTEIKYLEYRAIADMMRDVTYLGDKTLYQFCLDYKTNEDDYSSLYPLVAALNDGQLAMTQVSHYYDVVRYSVTSYSKDVMEEKLAEMEEKYGETPFNVYTGVDRTIYYGTFAITSAASRADAYTDESSLADAFFGDGNVGTTATSIVTGVLGSVLMAGAIKITLLPAQAAQNVANMVAENINHWVNNLATKKTLGYLNSKFTTFSYSDVVDHYMNLAVTKGNYTVDYASWTFADKVKYLDSHLSELGNWDTSNYMVYNAVSKDAAKTSNEIMNAEQPALNAGMSPAAKLLSGGMYVLGGALMLYSAISLIMTVYNYYHPDYEDIPLAMVDLIDTVDGDRYIKYDVVFEAETNDDGVYEAADLNAFEAERWNALYYTKSYEAGKPLLADEFSVSNTNNQPKENYAPVHRFGEMVCYNLNRYNFDYDTDIYLSVKQSKNNKSAVAEVPELLGSMFGTGFLLLAGGIGAIFGIGGTIFTQGIMKKKKAKAGVADADAEDTDNS